MLNKRKSVVKSFNLNFNPLLKPQIKVLDKLIRLYFTFNKTGLQPVSRPVKQILGFFRKVIMQEMEPKCVQKMFKKLTAP